MPARILDGKLISESIIKEIAEGVLNFRVSHGIVPGLAVILVGDNPASEIYVNNKIKKCREVGIYSEKVSFDNNVTVTDIQNAITSLNIRSDIHGILLQLPLPNTFDSSKLIGMIDSRKDVDGLHPLNVGKLLLNEKGFIPCTPKGIIELLDRYQINIEGKSAVVIGRSNIVGKPLGMLLLNRNATVTICHSRTRNLNQYTKKAEILVAAVGIPKFIKRDMIKEGAVIVDVGVNRIEKKIIGDVDYEGVVDSVSFITPVPGGVGPMTIAMLLRNTLLAAEESFDNS